MGGRFIAVDRGIALEAFDEPARRARIGHQTVAEAQAQAAQALGWSYVPIAEAALPAALGPRTAGPTVIAADHLYLTPLALRRFVKAAHQADRQADRRSERRTGGADHAPALRSLQVPASAMADYVAPLQPYAATDAGTPQPLLWLPPGAPLPEARNWPDLWARAEPLALPHAERVQTVPLPALRGQRTALRYPITASLVASVEHWVHVLWLNQLFLGAAWETHIRRHPLWALGRVLCAAPWTRGRVFDRFVARGPSTRIDRDAHVAASILGRNVRIGRNCTVRNCLIGDGVHIEDHSTLIGCVLMAGARVTTRSCLVSSVLYPGAVVGNYKLQLSLVGENSYVNHWAGFIDAKFRGAIRVAHRGAFVSTERQFLGSCVGHSATINSKILIQAGRAIPNGMHLVMNPEEVVHTLSADLPPNTPMVRSQGTLIPLEPTAAKSGPEPAP